MKFCSCYFSDYNILINFFSLYPNIFVEQNLKFQHHKRKWIFKLFSPLLGPTFYQQKKIVFNIWVKVRQRPSLSCVVGERVLLFYLLEIFTTHEILRARRQWYFPLNIAKNRPHDFVYVTLQFSIQDPKLTQLQIGGNFARQIGHGRVHSQRFFQNHI